MEKYTTFYIIRHGQSEGNVQKILQGQQDFKLTKFGERQAFERGKDLKNIKFAAAFSSDLLRAYRTAEIIALEHDLVVKTTDLLRERNYGKFQGLSQKNFPKEIQKIFNKWSALTNQEWMSHRLSDDFETGEEIISRFLLFIREIAVGYPGKNVLMVSHGDMMRNILVHLGWPSRENKRKFMISNTSYFVLQSDGVDFIVKDTKGIDIQS